MLRSDGPHEAGRVDPDFEAWVGREIGGYRLVSRLAGEGHRGEVYLADDLSLGRRVAVRLLPLSFSNDPERMRRFAEEVGAVSAANHPNIAAVHHIGEFDGRRFVVTEFVEGATLARRIESGSLSEAEAVEIVLQASAALRAAHRAGVVHREVGLDTLVVRSDGQVKVLNFGLAAPDAKADASTDIFQLCVIFRAMVTTPGPRLERILGRGCATDESQRYQKVDELIEELEAIRAPSPGRSRVWLRGRGPATAAAAIVASLLLGWILLRTAPSPTRPAPVLAILPLANAGGDPGLDYLGEGISEGVISELSKNPLIKVLARSTTFRFKGRAGAALEVGRELKADAILTGQVVSQGEAAQVELRLVEVQSGRGLWDGRYSVRPDAAPALENEIAQRVVERLRLPASAKTTRLMDPTAHTLYLKGRYQLTKRTKESLREAQILFEQALEHDPQQAVLHGGLAEAWALIGAYSVRSPADSFPKAIAAARRALEMDENLAEARAALALCLFLYEWDWDAAESEFRRVTQSQPGYATGHHWYAEYLMARGRSDEAVASLRRARELDPLSVVIAVDIGRAYYFGRRFKEARAECQRALDVSPGLVQAIECVAMVDLAEGRYEEAIANYREVIRQGIEAGPPGLMMALSAAGRQAEAEAELARVGPVERPAVQLIFAKGALGHRDEAFRDLEAARKERSNNLVYMKTDPRADRMRKDPRWGAFMRLAGLE